MGEQIKFVFHELNKEPFNKKFNLISFDSLRSEQLLQILNDVFAEIDSKMKCDVRTEDPEQLAVKSLGFLRILKYKPPMDISLPVFRQGIVSGEKSIVYHILEWLLRKLPDLKKRAYLAKYLVKVELSPEVEGDSDIVDLHHQYEQLIEQFKEVHKQNDTLRNSGFSTQEIRKDIGHMEEEKDQLMKKIERLKRKVEMHPNKDVMLEFARNLREEQDQADTLAQHRMNQQNSLAQAEQKIQRLDQQLKDLRQAGLGATPEGLIQKLEEEVRTNGYLVREKLPKEIALLKNLIQGLQKVASEPAMGQADLEKIQAKIQTVNTEINQLYEKKMMSNDPVDDKQTLFRQQAAIIARKKESAAEKLNELRSELTQIEEELQEKRKQASVFGGEEILKGEEFKRYVNKLRGKSTVYKQRRQKLAELRAETGVLARTEEILQQKEKSLSETLEGIEMQKGVGGFHVTQDELEKVSKIKAQFDEQKGQKLEDMSGMVQSLHAHIAEKKSRLAPIIKDLRPLRQKCQDLTYEYDQKKATYDSCAVGLESNMSKLEQEVSSLREEVNSDESQYHFLTQLKEFNKLQEEVVQKEINCYKSSDLQEKKNSLKEQLNKQINEQEKIGKNLREKQKEVRDGQNAAQHQVKMWQELQKLMECKIKCYEKKQASLQAAASAMMSDRLVL